MDEVSEMNVIDKKKYPTPPNKRLNELRNEMNKMNKVNEVTEVNEWMK